MAALDRGSVVLAFRRGRVALGTGKLLLVPWHLMAALRWMAMLRRAKVWFLTAALRLQVRLPLTGAQCPGTVPSREGLRLRVARRNL